MNVYDVLIACLYGGATLMLIIGFLTNGGE